MADSPRRSEPRPVERRTFLRYSLFGATAAGLGGFGLASLGMLWPRLGDGFFGEVALGTAAEIAAEVTAARAPLRIPEGGISILVWDASDDAASQSYGAEHAVLADGSTGLMAVNSQSCPHLGCAVPWCQTSQWFECPCHGSRYNRYGEWVGGPAPRGLDRYPSFVDDDGQFVVDFGNMLTGPARTANALEQNPKVRRASKPERLEFLMVQPILLVEAGGGGTVPACHARRCPRRVRARLLRRSGPAGGVAPGATRTSRSRCARTTPTRSSRSSGMERAMSWGVALAVFSGLFLGLYWLIEPGRINNAVDDFYAHDVQAGRTQYQNACASCHGVDLSGGSAPHPSADIDAPWPAPSLDNIVARYADSEVVGDVRQFIEMTLNYGRPGTPMQAFSTRSGGSLSDNQISQLVTYILSVQTGEVPDIDAQAFVGRSGEDLFGANCARCHGEQGEGYVGPQLLNVFERYGWGGDADDAGAETARAVVRDTVEGGRMVPGMAPMPPFDQVLTDDAIDAIIDHIESIQQTGGPRFGQVGGDPQPEDDA